MKVLKEAKNLNVYTNLLDILGDYTDKFPATGVDKFLNTLIDTGIKSIPKDKKVQDILVKVTMGDSNPEIVQNLLNLRFADLPVEIKPVYKNSNRKEVAFWCQDGKVYDKVISLIDTNKKGKGFWCDVDGKKISLINL